MGCGAGFQKRNINLDTRATFISHGNVRETGNKCKREINLSLRPGCSGAVSCPPTPCSPAGPLGLPFPGDSSVQTEAAPQTPHGARTVRGGLEAASPLSRSFSPCPGSSDKVLPTSPLSLPREGRDPWSAVQTRSPGPGGLPCPLDLFARGWRVTLLSRFPALRSSVPEPEACGPPLLVRLPSGDLTFGRRNPRLVRAGTRLRASPPGTLSGAQDAEAGATSDRVPTPRRPRV